MGISLWAMMSIRPAEGDDRDERDEQRDEQAPLVAHVEHEEQGGAGQHRDDRGCAAQPPPLVGERTACWLIGRSVGDCSAYDIRALQGTSAGREIPDQARRFSRPLCSAPPVATETVPVLPLVPSQEEHPAARGGVRHLLGLRPGLHPREGGERGAAHRAVGRAGRAAATWASTSPRSTTAAGSA